MAILIKTIVPVELKKIININNETIESASLISVSNPPQILTNDIATKDSVSIHDALAMVVKIISNENIEGRLVYIIAENVMIIENQKGTIINIGGLMQVLDDATFLEFYKNDAETRSMTSESIEEFLEINKNKSISKIFSEINEYFTAENYQVNNNIFRLIKHRDQSLQLAKKILVKSLIAWQLKQ